AIAAPVDVGPGEAADRGAVRIVLPRLPHALERVAHRHGELGARAHLTVRLDVHVPTARAAEAAIEPAVALLRDDGAQARITAGPQERRVVDAQALGGPVPVLPRIDVGVHHVVGAEARDE